MYSLYVGNLPQSQRTIFASCSIALEKSDPLGLLHGSACMLSSSLQQDTRHSELSVVLTAALYETTLFSLPGATGPGFKKISLIDPCTGASNATGRVTPILVHAIVAPVATVNALVWMRMAHIPRLILGRPLQS
jgi:hypothetical protein